MHRLFNLMRIVNDFNIRWLSIMNLMTQTNVNAKKRLQN